LKQPTNDHDKSQLGFIRKRLFDMRREFERLTREIEIKKERHSMLDSTIRHYTFVENDLSESIGVPSQESMVDPVVDRHSSQDFSQLTIAQAAQRLLGEKQPQLTAELQVEMKQRGKEVPKQSVQVTLHRHKDKFIGKRVGQQTHWSLRGDELKASVNVENDSEVYTGIGKY